MSPSNKTLCKPQLEQSHPDQALHQTRQSNDSNNTSTTASLHRTHTSQQHLNISFSTPDSHYPTTYNMSTPPGYRMSRSIKDDQPIDLMGPVDVLGYVKSGSGVNLTGEVIVREKLEAYGAIFINGSVSCGGRIKAYGNIIVHGYLSANEKIKGSGKLKVVGSLEGTDLEIYGNLSIQGRLTCRRLVVYGSLTLIGSEAESSYYVEELEQIAGPVIRREQEADWDW